MSTNFGINDSDPLSICSFSSSSFFGHSQGHHRLHSPWKIAGVDEYTDAIELDAATCSMNITTRYFLVYMKKIEQSVKFILRTLVFL